MQIQTVTGPVALDSLGRTLMHEHLFIAFPGAQFDPTADFDRAGFVAEASRRLRELREVHGVRSFVDPCPIELGRDPALMAEIADRAEMNDFPLVSDQGDCTGDLALVDEFLHR